MEFSFDCLQVLPLNQNLSLISMTGTELQIIFQCGIESSQNSGENRTWFPAQDHSYPDVFGYSQEVFFRKQQLDRLWFDLMPFWTWLMFLEGLLMWMSAPKDSSIVHCNNHWMEERCGSGVKTRGELLGIFLCNTVSLDLKTLKDGLLVATRKRKLCRAAVWSGSNSDAVLSCKSFGKYRMDWMYQFAGHDCESLSPSFIILTSDAKRNILMFTLPITQRHGQQWIHGYRPVLFRFIEFLIL